MKIAFFDLEATNLDADFGRILCACIRDLETKETTTYRCDSYNTFKKEPWNDSKLCIDIRDHLHKYDIIVTWYGKMYDVKYLQARLLINRESELRKIKHIDLYFQARNKLKVASGRLEKVSLLLGIKGKTPLHPEVWVRATAGDHKSLDYVVDHCQKDVSVLHAVYNKLSKFVERITK